MARIDRVPVSLVVPIEDTWCPPEYNEWIYAEIKSEEKYLRYELGPHFIFSFWGTDNFISRMVETIEVG